LLIFLRVFKIKNFSQKYEAKPKSLNSLVKKLIITLINYAYYAISIVFRFEIICKNNSTVDLGRILRNLQPFIYLTFYFFHKFKKTKKRFLKNDDILIGLIFFYF